MKSFIIHPDSSGRYDPPGTDSVRQIPDRTEKREEADVFLIPVARFDGFKFDERLNDLEKPWVLFDWTENGWEWPAKTTVQFGLNFMQHGYMRDIENPEWRKFDDFIRNHPPIMRFHRELCQQDQTPATLPLDYLWWTPEKGQDDRETFLKRPLDCLYNWGRSSEYRMQMHGAVFAFAGAFGYDVITEWSHIAKSISDAPQSRKWASIHAPHYARIDVKEVQDFLRMSKTQIIMGGAGRKVFRHGECCGDSVMAMQEDGLAWAYPWVDGVNCLKLPIRAYSRESDYETSIARIANLVMEPERLWEMYVNAMGNARNYRPENYMRRYVYQNIERVL